MVLSFSFLWTCRRPWASSTRRGAPVRFRARVWDVYIWRLVESQAGRMGVGSKKRSNERRRDDKQGDASKRAMYREYQGRKTDPIAWLIADRSKHQSSKQQMDLLFF